MTKQTETDYKKVTTMKKVVVMTGLFGFFFWGIIGAAISISKFENYLQPYLFGLCFGTIGLLIGFIVAKRLKPHIILTQKMHTNYFAVVMYIATGFIGSLMLLGQLTNNSLSSIDKCENYFVVDKAFRKGGFRRAELNVLTVDIDGKAFKILTNNKYWRTITVGQKINVCVYKSKIGFDYLVLTDDK